MKKLERFFAINRHKGIPNLMTIITFANAVVYILSLVPALEMLPNALIFNRAAILQGQVWRVITFIFVPQNGGNIQGIFFTAIMLYLYWMIGSTLEREWGPLKFNIYYLTGVVGLCILGFLTNAWLDASYLNLSMFFAFATLYPDMQFLIFFIFPVKVKWLALLDAVFFALAMFILPGLSKLVPIVAILNYILYFYDFWIDFFRRRPRRPLPGSYAAQNTVQFKKAVRDKREKQGYIHKCSVCGKTDADSPNEEFRYCSLCKDYKCYCAEHLFNHDHI